MSDDEFIQNALHAVHSRLGAIEGKVNLVARAECRHLLGVLEQAVREKPLLGQIYLVLDGKRTQTEVREKLAEFGIRPGQATVSRHMTAMETDHGIAHLVRSGKTTVYAKDPAMEQILNLTRNVRKWLSEENQTVPEQSTQRKRAKS